MVVSPNPVTCGEVLNDASRCRVEDDVGTIVQVMQVIATVKSSVAKHMVESQLLHSHTEMKVALRGKTHTLGAATYLRGPARLVKQPTAHYQHSASLTP